MAANLSLLALGRLIRQILTTDPKLSLSVGPAVFPVVEEEETQLPYINFRRSSIQIKECRGTTIPVETNFEIIIWAETYDGCCSIADEVIECLQGATYQNDGIYVSRAYLENAVEGWGGDAFYQQLSFRFNTNPLKA